MKRQAFAALAGIFLVSVTAAATWMIVAKTHASRPFPKGMLAKACEARGAYDVYKGTGVVYHHGARGRSYGIGISFGDYVVTAGHVVKNGGKVSWGEYGTIRREQLRVAYRDPEIDFVVLKRPSSPHSDPRRDIHLYLNKSEFGISRWVCFFRPTIVPNGAGGKAIDVVALGGTYALSEKEWSNGKEALYYPELSLRSYELIFLSEFVAPGTSGSPLVVEKSGKAAIVGMVVAWYPRSDISIAISFQEICKRVRDSAKFDLCS